MVTELLAKISYVDVALLLLIIFSFISGIVAQKKTKKKIEENTSVLKKYQEDVSEGMDKKYASLKGVLVDRINKLTTKLNAILKSNETLILEIDKRTKPLRASIDDAIGKIKDTNDTLKKAILENEKKSQKEIEKMGKEISDFSGEMKKMGKEISDFSKDIQKMEDDIRERTIDLEL